MKKNIFIYPAMCLVMVFFLFVIPVSAFFSLEILGVNSAKSFWEIAYKVLADHGSLIAGGLAVVTAFFTIKFHQKKAEKESLDADRRESLECVLEIQQASNKIAKNLDFTEINLGDIESLDALSRSVFKKALFIKSYFGKIGDSGGVYHSSLILLQARLFQSYLNHSRVLLEYPEFKRSCEHRNDDLNNELSILFMMRASGRNSSNLSSVASALYLEKFKFNLKYNHRNNETHLSNAWYYVSTDISELLLKELLRDEMYMVVVDS